MQKLELVIVTVIMFGLAASGSSRMATATQPRSTLISSTIYHSSFGKASVRIALAGKKCTIRRYRRPH
jgi:hypothetical protein